MLKERFKVNGLFTTKGIERYLREYALSHNKFDQLGVDLFVVGKVVGDFPGALALAILLHHLGNLRRDRFLGGGRVALCVEFAGTLGVLALRLKSG